MAKTLVIKIQPNSVLTEYIGYVESKIEIDEVPMTFQQWADYEKEEKSPISEEFINH